MVRLAWLSAERVRRDELPPPEVVDATPWEAQELPRLRRAAAYLRGVLAELGLG